jgi:hypothetical protein
MRSCSRSPSQRPRARVPIRTRKLYSCAESRRASRERNREPRVRQSNDRDHAPDRDRGDEEGPRRNGPRALTMRAGTHRRAPHQVLRLSRSVHTRLPCPGSLRCGRARSSVLVCGRSRGPRAERLAVAVTVPVPFSHGEKSRAAVRRWRIERSTSSAGAPNANRASTPAPAGQNGPSTTAAPTTIQTKPRVAAR